MKIKHRQLLLGVALVLVHGSAAAYQEGWTAENILDMTDRCVSGIMDPIRQGFEKNMKSRGKASVHFPEEQYKPPVSDLCTCITLRAANSEPYENVQKDPEITRSYMTEAIKGGECKPGGILGNIMQQ